MTGLYCCKLFREQFNQTASCVVWVISVWNYQSDNRRCRYGDQQLVGCR